MRLLSSQSFSKGIVSSTVLNVFAKGIQFANTILIAFYFGANRDTDLYYFILAISLLIATLINSLDNIVFIPEFIKLRETRTEQQAFKFLNLYIYLYAILGLLIAVFVLLLSSSSMSVIFNINISAKNLAYIKAAGVLPFLMLITNLFSAIANAYNYFTVPVIINLVNSVVVTLVTLFFHNSLGPMCGIVALLAGYSINIALLLYILLSKIKWTFKKASWSVTAHLRTSIGVSYLTLLPITLRNYMVSYLFSGFGGGVLTAVNWGQQMAALPDVFITNQIVNITSIKFSEFYAKQERQKAYELFYNITEYLFVILFACMAVSLIYSHEIITILLSRGSFNEEKAAITVTVFALLSVQPVINLFPIVAARLFVAFQLLKKTTIVTTISHIIITVLLFFSIKKYGYIGFGIASLAGYLFQTFLYLYITKKTFKGIDIKQIFYRILKPIAALTAALFILYFIHRQLIVTWEKYVSFFTGSIAFLYIAVRLYKSIILSYLKKPNK